MQQNELTPEEIAARRAAAQKRWQEMTPQQRAAYRAYKAQQTPSPAPAVQPDNPPQKQRVKKPAPLWYRVAIVACVAVFVVSGALLLNYFITTQKDKNNLKAVAGEVVNAQQQVSQDASLDPNIVLEQYAQLARRNPDMVGWLSIDGTSVNAPVMHTPQSPEYYLRRDFDKNDSISGMLFLDGTNDLTQTGTNLIIYGHNMKNNTMFSDVARYTDAGFRLQHPTVQFDTLDARAAYQVFAVFEVDASVGNEAALQCYSYRGGDEAAHADFIEYVKKYAKYEKELLPQQGDTLLTLSTCDNITENGRIAVMAKKMA